MTYLCLSVAAGYLALCIWISAKSRNFRRGGWSTFTTVCWHQWTVGVVVHRVSVPCYIVHIGPIAVYVDYDEFSAKIAARKKMERKLVDSLVGSATYRGDE